MSLGFLGVFDWLFSWARGLAAEVVFLSIALVGATYSVFSLFFGGIGDDGDGGNGDDGDGDAHAAHLSLRSIAWFATGFGSVGFLVHRFTEKVLVSSLAGVMSGVGAAGFGVWLIGRFKKQQVSSVVRADDFLNLYGEVRTSIPAQGTGEVSVSVKGRLVVKMARSEDASPLPSGSLVQVTRVVGDYLIVKKSP